MRTFKETTRRTILAVVIGPLSIIPAMVVAQTFIFFISPANPPELMEQFRGGLLISAIGLLYSYGFTLFYGVPVYFVLKKTRKNNALYVLTASVAPAIVFLLSAPDAWPFYLHMAYFSIVVGFVCWFIAVRVGQQVSNNQHNKDAPKSGAPVS